jgi:hypothetical protein
MEEYLENMKSLRSYMNGVHTFISQPKLPFPDSLPLIFPPPLLDGCIMGCRSGGGRHKAVGGRAAAAHGHRRPLRRHRARYGQWWS